MTVRRISTQEASALLDAGATYVDVRTEAEYAAGHPAGALNVPYLLSVEGGMAPNPDFLQVMTRIFRTDARLILGCASGVRSARAANALRDAGFTAIADLRPGYSGVRDPFGQLVEKGWHAAGFPIELVTVGSDYESLRRRA